MRNEGGGFAANIYGRCPKVCDGRFPRIASLPLEGKVPRRGRIGHSRHERQLGKAEKCAAHVGKA